MGRELGPVRGPLRPAASRARRVVCRGASTRARRARARSRRLSLRRTARLRRRRARPAAHHGGTGRAGARAFAGIRGGDRRAPEGRGPSVPLGGALGRTRDGRSGSGRDRSRHAHGRGGHMHPLRARCRQWRAGAGRRTRVQPANRRSHPPRRPGVRRPGVRTRCDRRTPLGRDARRVCGGVAVARDDARRRTPCTSVLEHASRHRRSNDRPARHGLPRGAPLPARGARIHRPLLPAVRRSAAARQQARRGAPCSRAGATHERRAQARGGASRIPR